MAKNGNGDDKKKVNRQKGGFALVEVKEGDGGTGRVLEIIVSDLDGQKECRDELRNRIESGDIVGDGKRTFGIIQAKDLNLVPQVKTSVTF